MKSAGEIFLSGLRGAKTFFKRVSDRFSDLFSRFSNRFSCRFKSFSGVVSFCRHAALKRCDRILLFVLGQLSSHFGAISSLNYTENLETNAKKLRKSFPRYPDSHKLCIDIHSLQVNVSQFLSVSVGFAWPKKKIGSTRNRDSLVAGVWQKNVLDLQANSGK